MEVRKKLPLTRILIGVTCGFIFVGIAALVLFVNYNVAATGGTQMESGMKVEARSYGLLSGGVGLDTVEGVKVSIGGKRIDIAGDSVTVDDELITTIDERTALLEIVHRDGTIELTADGKAIASLQR